MLAKNKRIVISLLIGIIFTASTLNASSLGLYYNNYILTDSDTSQSAQGLNLLGVKGNLKGIFFFEYEQPQGEDQKSLEEYSNNSSDIANYVQKIRTGIKLFKYFDNKYIQNAYVEYMKDVYQLKFNTYTKFYTQELLFVGLKFNHYSEIEKSYGIFLHNSKEEFLYNNSNQYSSEENKNVYGLLYQMDNILIPYSNGRPEGIKKYGTGVLVDDVKVQYQISGGNDYFFSLGLGLGHRSRNLEVYAKYIFEMTTDTLVGKTVAGIDYSF